MDGLTMTAHERTPLRTIVGTTAVLARPNVDTDLIIPARFLTTTTRSGLGAHLFADLRSDGADGSRPGLAPHRPEARGATILVAGENFGCGSSREHAAWALLDFGFRAVLAPSFGDIFRRNALGNGLVVAAVDAALHRRLVAAPGREVEVDVDACEVRLADGTRGAFPLDPFARHCLLEGVDELGWLLAQSEAIARFEAAHREPR
jgi:3-isopropylmalate/(R)-2-methylmalate dehydratase small subunit